MFIIFSVFRTENSNMQNEVNLHKTKRLLDYYNIDYTEVLGCYKGSTEQSLRVPMAALGVIKAIAGKYNQESILLVDAENRVSLLFQNGETMDLGRLQEISEAEAFNSEAWSLIGNKYYKAA
jgi:hypothetical protein